LEEWSIEGAADIYEMGIAKAEELFYGVIVVFSG
jgi:hypothetical protein